MSGIIKPPVGIRLNLDHPLAAGLCGCWLFNEGSGSKVHDYSGQGNMGTLTNINDPPISTSGWSAGLHGGAITFDGSDDYLEVTRSTSIEPARLTLLAWVYFLGMPENSGVIFDKANTSHADPYYDYHLRSDAAGASITFAIPIGAYTTADALTITGLSLLNKTSFISATYDQTTMRLYLNGIEIGNKVNTGTITYHNTNLIIGSFRNLTTGNFSGLIYSTMIYDRALSANEIAYLYAFPYCMFDEPIHPTWMTTIEVLGASAQVENVKRSLEKYIWDNIYTTEGISVDFSGVPFNNKNSIEWVTPRFLINRTYVSKASGTEYGYDNHIVLNITANVKKSGATISDKHYMMRDSIVNYFKIGEDINLNDWVGDGSYICNMRVREVIEDYALPESDELLSYKVVLGINYTEQTNKDD